MPATKQTPVASWSAKLGCPRDDVRQAVLALIRQALLANAKAKKAAK